jgi:hypothetical protein
MIRVDEVRLSFAMTTASFNLEPFAYQVCRDYDKKKAAFLKGANAPKVLLPAGRVIER